MSPPPREQPPRRRTPPQNLTWSGHHRVGAPDMANVDRPDGFGQREPRVVAPPLDTRLVDGTVRGIADPVQPPSHQWVVLDVELRAVEPVRFVGPPKGVVQKVQQVSGLGVLSTGVRRATILVVLDSLAVPAFSPGRLSCPAPTTARASVGGLATSTTRAASIRRDSDVTSTRRHGSATRSRPSSPPESYVTPEAGKVTVAQVYASWSAAQAHRCLLTEVKCRYLIHQYEKCA